jgi:hypothetical protein
MFRRLERLARWSYPLILLLTSLGVGMLYFGASDRSFSLFVAAYFIIAAPMLLVALSKPLAVWRDSKGPPQDIPEEWR